MSNWGGVIGPDGNLYVSTINLGIQTDVNEVLKYTGTGSSISSLGTFVTNNSGGLNGPEGLIFGADGNLYVSSLNSNSILEYNGTNGAFITSFISNVSYPIDLVMQPTTATPEPSSLALCGTALLTGLGYFRWRRRKPAVA